MKQERITRAESISKRLISEFIITKLQELSAEYGIITITKIDISSDLSYLDVYVSSLKPWAETLVKALAEHAHPIHRLLGQKIDFIKVPKIRFRYDETGKHSFDIHQTLQEVL